MRSTSVKFDQSESKIYPKVVFSFRDGRKLNIEDPDLFKISGNGFAESAGQSSFPLGAAIAKTATISLWNDDDRYQDYDFYMSKFSLYVYKLFDEADGSSGREEILIGNFTVIEREDYGTAVDVTGIDDMYKFDVPYDPKYTFPISVQDAVRQECSSLGVSLLTTVFKNGDIVISKRPENITIRQFIGMAAQIASGNAKMDPFNRLIIQPFDFSPFESSAEDVYVLSEFKDDPQKSSDDVVITGVQIVSGEESFLSGETGYVLQMENQLVSGKEQQIADLIGADIIGFRFRPFNGEHFSVIKPEFMDLIYFTDRKGRKYQSVLTDYDFQFSSYTTLKCSAADPIRNSSNYMSEATKAIVQARINAEKQISEYDKAVQMMTSIMANSLGMYQTVEKTPSGGEIIYQHDKPLLSESKTIWKKTENGFTVSTDGGKTWNAGMDASGNAVINVLSAIGLNAQWIDAGAIMVKDENGKIVFMVNLDTKEVIIDGSHIQIGDKTLDQALMENGALAMQLSNDYINVPVDKDGNYKELNISVKPSVFYGMEDITENCVFHITNSQNISGKWSDTTKTYTIESLTADIAWVEIQAVYLKKYSISKRLTVAKLYGGADGKSYMMEASSSLIEVVNGGLSADSVTFSGYSVSEITREEYAGRFVIRECDHEGRWTTVYTSEQDETNITYSLYNIYTVGNGDALVVGYPEDSSQGGFGILTVPQMDIKEIECTLYAAGGTDSILFIQRIPIIKSADMITSDEVFRLLTNDGEAKGIYKEGNQLFISFNYAKGGILKLGGKNNGNGNLEIYDANDIRMGKWSNDGFEAIKGKIGGWIIDDHRMYGGDSNTGVAAMQRPGPDNMWTFAAGGKSHEKYEDCPFRVSKYGKLYAENAEIKGKLEATSGTFKGELKGATGTFSGTVSAGKVTGSSISGGSLSIGGNFSVGGSGNLFARNPTFGQYVFMYGSSSSSTDMTVFEYDGSSLAIAESGMTIDMRGIYLYNMIKQNDFHGGLRVRGNLKVQVAVSREMQRDW